MKSYYILLVAAAALLSSASGISLTQDGGTSTVVKRSPRTFDGVQVNGESGRFLRSYTERDDSEDPADEERGINSEEIDSWVSKLVTNAVEELPATLKRKDLDKILSKLIAKENGLFKEFAQKGTTPESMYRDLNISQKLRTLPDEELEVDADLRLFLHYEIYWTKVHRKKTPTWFNKLLGKFQKEN